jgi:hypothetical protein
LPQVCPSMQKKVWRAIFRQDAARCCSFGPPS